MKHHNTFLFCHFESRLCGMRNLASRCYPDGRFGQRDLAFVLLFLIASISLTAQNLQLSPVVQPAMGHNVQVGSLNISGTVGQPANTSINNGNLLLTQGFQQPERPLPPVAPASQSVCSDSAYTFTFANVLAGAGADQVEWSLHSNFDTSHIIASGDTIQVTVASGANDTVWLRSRVSAIGYVSSFVSTGIGAQPYPLPTAAYAIDTLVLKGDSSGFVILNSQLGIIYSIEINGNEINNGIGNSDTLILKTSTIDSSTHFILCGRNPLTNCKVVILGPILVIANDCFATEREGDYIYNFNYILSQNGKNYFQLREELESYFEYKPVEDSASAENDEDGEWANYQRWRKFWENRIDSSGSASAYKMGNDDLQQNNGVIPGDCSFLDFDVKWTCIGPFESGSSEENQGRITCFAVDPNNSSIIYAGTPAGGIFKTTNANDAKPEWINVTDASGYGGVGVGAILINPADPNWIIAGTNTNSPGVWNTGAGDYSFGLIQSFDAGQTWVAVPTLSPLPPASSPVGKMLLLRTSQSDHMDLVVVNKRDVTFVKVQKVAGETVVSSSILRLPPGEVVDLQTPPLTVGLPQNEIYDDIQQDPNDANVVYLSGYRTKEAYNHWGDMQEYAFLFKIDLSAGLSTGAWDNTHYDATSSANLLSYRTSSVTAICSTQVCHDSNGSYTNFNTTQFTHTFNWHDISWLNFSLATHYVANVPHTRIYAHLQYRYNVSFITPTADLYCVKSFTLPSQTAEPTDWENVIAYCDGTTWSTGSTPSLPWIGVTHVTGMGTIQCSPLNENVIYTEGTCGGPTICRHMMVSTDAGQTFSTMNNGLTHGDIRCFAVLQSNATSSIQDVLLQGNDGGIAIKRAGANTWTSINGYGLNIGEYYGLGNTEKNAHRIYAGAQDGSHQSFNKTWDYQYSSSDNGDALIISDYPSAGGETIVYEGNWILKGPLTINGPSCGLNNCFYLMPLASNPHNKLEMFVGFKYLERGRIDAVTHSQISPFGSSVTSIAKGYNSAGDADVIYYSTNSDNYLYKAIDDGSTSLAWFASGTITNAHITDIALDPEEANHVFVSLGNYNATEKVYESNDEGEHWTNVSGCIPNFPVNSIVYQPENDRLFVGTNIGVYFGTRNGAGTFDWHKLGGMPDVQVYDMEINNCGQKLQIATFGRSIWECDLPPLILYEVNSPGETWASSRNQYASVIIHNDAELHITGSAVINMARGTTITVEPGGKLLVDDEATITNSCGSMWDGIIVKGNPNEPQTITSGTSNQGYLVINNATIENAYEAVRLWDPKWTNGSIGTGGIVQAIGAKFINNRRSAEFMQYHNWLTLVPELTEAPNKSYFMGCTFETNDNHIDEHPFSAFVTAWSVAPIHFTGCTFENLHNITTSTKDVELGDGITTIDAGIIVDDFVPSDGPVTRCKFTNLHHGVLMMNQIFTQTSRVQHARFNNCLRGIRNEGVDLCTFVGNDFKMGDNPAQITPVNGFIQFPTEEGIILHGQMAGFTVEQNTFSLSAGVTEPSHLTIGIRSDGTGETNNRIYKNTFTGLHIADLGNRQNRNAIQTIFTGLSYECNDNTSNVFYDFSVTEPDMNDPQYLQTGVRRNQGLISLAAGDKFTAFTTGEGHFGDYTGKDVFYYHRNTTVNPAPVYTTNNVQYRLSSIDNTCASNFAFPTEENPTGGGHLTGLTFSGYTSAFSIHRAAYNQYAAQLNALLDGGITQAMMMRADTTSNAAKLYDTLFSYSPNLSTLVLDIVAKRSSLLNDTLQYNILKANAEGVSSDVIKDWVKWAAPPQWMRDSVNAARYTLTYRSYLLDTVLYHAAEKDYALHDALRLIEEDSAGFNLSLYRTWLDSADNAWAKRKKINTYLFEGKFDTIATMLADLDTIITTTIADSISFKNYKDYVLAYRGWMETDTFLNRLDSAHVQDLATIAGLNEHSKGSQMARNVLNFFYDSLYFTPPMLPDLMYSKKGDEEFVPTPSVTLVNERNSVRPAIKLYPNPAQNKVTIEYAGINESSNLYVVNILGMIVETLGLNTVQGKLDLNTSAYQNGIYLIRIEGGGKPLVKDKFIILK